MSTDGQQTATGPGTPVDKPRIERAVREILVAIGEDPDRDGLAEVVLDLEGLWTRYEDPTALYERIGELDRRACRKAVETRFSAARMVEDHLTLYERLLAGDDQVART